jgi:hypothetical protein
MAFEISEGAAAAALLLSKRDLESNINSTNILSIMQKIYNFIIDPNAINMSNAERRQYSAWFDPRTIEDSVDGKSKDARLTAVLHGISGARGIKKWFRNSQNKESNDIVEKGDVFVTGAQWPKRINFLKISVGGWDDYNSSDLIVIKGSCYYGISLKKKDKMKSANPPMINKSFVALMTEIGQKEIADDFYKARVEYFGGIVEKEVKTGILKSRGVNNISKEDLFQTVLKHPYKSSTEWVNLIDLKGRGALNIKSGKTKYEWNSNNGPTFVAGVGDVTKEEFKNNAAVMELFGYESINGSKPKPKSAAHWDMRKKVNSILGQSSNKLYKKINVVATDKFASIIGEKLLAAVLKTELKETIDKQKEIAEGAHFGFALVTALGKFSNGNVTAEPFDAIVKNNPTIQSLLGSMSGTDEWSIKIDEKLTESTRKKAEARGSAPPAKLFFLVSIGKHDILNLEVRYKGSFSPSPQFIGGITKEFEKLLESKDNKLHYDFQASCNTR